MQTIWDCLTCSSNPSLYVNSQGYSITRLLGEGGYAYVYLIEPHDSNKKLAMKKIRCMFGGESVANAMQEVEAGNVFKFSDRVSNCLDSSVVQEQDGTKTVYIIMPYYAHGSLQDRITERIVSSRDFTLTEVLAYALGAARALEVMHTFRPSSSPRLSVSSNRRQSTEDEAQHLLVGDNGDTELGLSELVPYAHRDLKPANIMLTTSEFSGNEAHAVLIDLGFCSPALMMAATRKDAVHLQDLASEHCTLPFRAPELFDVRTGSKIDEKVDIWAFGCTLYNTMYLSSPFEREEQVSGANINLSIMRAKFSFPEEPSYPLELKDLVKRCLQISPSDRPTIQQIIETLESLAN